eukprot:comp18362_c0_seq1/m.19513 comp18362_c0_seq1/g.19513  ORF comp18362_c0_seq1/g.19513 comp18362_c0_seq1/m.19513 type:complete len:322 (-) comp18362_c0_seq1:272-1237(-)
MVASTDSRVMAKEGLVVDPPHGVGAVVSSILTYCLFSMTMMYSNKFVLSSYQFKYPWALVTVQCLITVVLLRLLDAFTSVKVPHLQARKAQDWLPCTMLFVAMLFTGTKSLQYLSIPIVTVFKNLTNIFVAYGDKYFYNKPVSTGIMFALWMMVLGSLLAGWTDLQFDIVGYFWMVTNCLSTGGYTLYVHKARSKTGLDQWGMSFYNNALTVPLTVIPMVLFGELTNLPEYPYLWDGGFQFALFVTGAVGTALSLASFWCQKETSPTTYSMMGALNKIPMTIISYFLFAAPINFSNACSIAFGLFSGVVYAYIKLKEMPKK